METHNVKAIERIQNSLDLCMNKDKIKIINVKILCNFEENKCLQIR